MDIHKKETVTCAEMVQLENEGEAKGLPKIEMMENAGRSSAEFLESLIPDGQKKKIGIFCGRGNNGGDGFVMARYLKESGHSVDVYLVDGEPKTKDARANYDKARDMIAFKEGGEARRSGGFDFIVDAIYGTGFLGTPREKGKHGIEIINFFGKQRSTVIALDIPSGLSGDGEVDPVTGEVIVPEIAVHADYTLTFHAKKPVHDMKSLNYYVGEVKVIDIGIGNAIDSY